ncbi:hypothetical protein MATL_G00078790 [Megalops atlanticus]|uniref:Uncharacterized protein n=1 Tax=Megalops atlanticus TaxID=7932 RepID=A0A9D3Q977_MEGAT|nr:hypothetical protein MATL_G00078790 [Megalops atlanticus]
MQSTCFGDMGGGQSSEKPTEPDRGNARPSPQPHEVPTSPPSNAVAAERPPEVDLPQCRMGNKTVDNMCFMISCTNWY